VRLHKKGLENRTKSDIFFAAEMLINADILPGLYNLIKPNNQD